MQVAFNYFHWKVDANNLDSDKSSVQLFLTKSFLIPSFGIKRSWDEKEAIIKIHQSIRIMEIEMTLCFAAGIKTLQKLDICSLE